MTAGVFPSLADIEAALGAPAAPSADPLRLAILREVTVEPLDSYLRFLARRDGMDAQVTFSGFGGLAVEALGDGNLLNRALDAVLVFAPLATLSSGLSSGFAALSAGALKSEVERLKALFETTVHAIRARTGAAILWHGLEPPLYPALGILDAQRADGQSAVIADLNAALRSTLQTVPDGYFVDMASCLARIGGPQFYDARFWHLAQAPYTPGALAEIAAEDFKFLRAGKGKAKKCLVLDADNTLWGGVVGEDGVGGIALGPAYPGSAFLAFQREVVSLFQRGVIIALCSRNNEDDVWEVFQRHPEMVLRREHVAAWRIDWRDKATNLRELAGELNIGLDSLVLVDDSPFETGLVRDQLPEVEIIELPSGRPGEYQPRLASSGWFDLLTLTAEDRARGAMYTAEATRRRARAGAHDLENYYQSLEMTLDVGYTDDLSIARVAQLTQRTNQFNLTTRRYADGDIARLVNSPRHDVLWVRLADRLGDSGIVGVCILEYSEGGQDTHIDTLLLSCRALGRGVEQRFLSEVLHISLARGASRVTGEYVRTAKNAQVEQFFPANGFTRIDTAEPASAQFFECALEQVAPRALAHFASVASPLGALLRQPA